MIVGLVRQLRTRFVEILRTHSAARSPSGMMRSFLPFASPIVTSGRERLKSQTVSLVNSM